MMSIGDVAVAPSNPSMSGSAPAKRTIAQSSSWGDGVYKSIDGGKTWKYMGLADTHAHRSHRHPSHQPRHRLRGRASVICGDRMPSAACSRRRTADRRGRRSLYRRREHRRDRSRRRSAQSRRRCSRRRISASARRGASTAAGRGSGIYRTRDGGATWTRLTNGLPAGDKGRIGLDVSPCGSACACSAVVEARAAATAASYRSTDGGDTWEAWSNSIRARCTSARSAPTRRTGNRVYILGSNRGFYVSTTRGRNFRDVFSTVHSEDHALWIDPADTNHLIVGGDGGVSISWDRGQTWLFRDNLPVGQFYEISADMQDPYVICGGLQDNGHWCTPSATRLRTGISNRDAFNIGSGDGFYARIDPTDPRTAFVESQEGRANRVNVATLERQAVAPLPPERLKKGERERWNWNTPMAMSAFDPRVIYIGSHVVFRSGDGGVTWKPVSPDLTAHLDRDALQMMGARVPSDALSRHDGQTSFSTLTTIGESPIDENLLYTGSDDGQLYVTRNGGQNWTNLTPRLTGVPAGTYVSSVLPSRHSAGRVFATFDGHYNDDYRPYVFVSDDFGQSWRSIVSGLPATAVHRMREHPRNAQLLFAGHERGIHVSLDGGVTWSSLNLNMPPVPVDDILIHPRDNDLIVGTHGRSLWVMDNIASLEALASGAVKSDAFLVPPPRARLLSIYTPQAWYGAGQFFAPNPDFGAAIEYYLREPSNQEVAVRIVDAQGATVRTLRGSARGGMNRVSWDLRMDPLIVDGAREAPAQGAGGAPQAPLVMPGVYKVKLDLGGRQLEGDLKVDGDPRVAFPDRDRSERQTLLLALYELEKTLLTARAAASAGVIHFDALARTSRLQHPPQDRLRALQTEIGTAMTTIAFLFRSIEGYSGLPTADQRRQIDWAFDDAGKTVEALNDTLQTGGAQPTELMSIPKRP